MTWRVGLRWNPSPGSSVSLSYGRSDDNENFNGSLTQEIGPRTRLVASYAETVNTAQDRLQRDLSFLDVGEDGGFIDSRTGLPFDQNTSPFDIDDRTTRNRRFSSALTRSSGPNAITVRATYGTQEDVSEIENTETNIAGSVTWSRQLSPRAGFNLSGSVRHIDFAEAGRGDEDRVRLRSSLSYRAAINLSVSAGYAAQRQFADVSEDEFTESVVTLSGNLSF